MDAEEFVEDDDQQPDEGNPDERTRDVCSDVEGREGSVGECEMEEFRRHTVGGDSAERNGKSEFGHGVLDGGREDDTERGVAEKVQPQCSRAERNGKTRKR